MTLTYYRCFINSRLTRLSWLWAPCSVEEWGQIDSPATFKPILFIRLRGKVKQLIRFAVHWPIVLIWYWSSCWTLLMCHSDCCTVTAVKVWVATAHSSARSDQLSITSRGVRLSSDQLCFIILDSTGQRQTRKIIHEDTTSQTTQRDLIYTDHGGQARGHYCRPNDSVWSCYRRSSALT